MTTKTKTKALVRTILDQSVRDQIALKIAHGIADCWRLVYSDNKADPDNKEKKKGRSSTKTDALHRMFVDVLIAALGPFALDFIFVAETGAASGDKKGKTERYGTKDLFGDKFNLDGAILSLGKELLAAILLKAPLQSIQKNRKNAIGHSFGEIIRLMSPLFAADQSKRLITIPMVPIGTFCDSKGVFSVETCHNLCLSSDDASGSGRTILESSCLDNKVKSRIHELPVLYTLNFNGLALKSIECESDLRSAIAAANDENHCFIKIEESSLDFIAVFVQEFLTSTGDPVHAAYLADNASRLVAKPKMASAKIMPKATSAAKPKAKNAEKRRGFASAQDTRPSA